MNYYHNAENAASYVAMCEGYDAAGQLQGLYSVLPENSSLLEIGSGPGNDMALLKSRYHVTGSDYSPAFIDILKLRFPESLILSLDAVSIETDKQFDGIYSNKVLHHLTDVELESSFRRQAELTKSGGFVFHLIWQYVENPKVDEALIFKARNADEFTALMGDSFELVSAEEFGEFEKGDSIAILARKV